MNFDDYFTTAEAATELNRKKSDVLRWAKKNKFAGAIKKGWNWFIPKTEVARFKESLGR